jgi:hypothetical protein
MTSTEGDMPDSLSERRPLLPGTCEWAEDDDGVWFTTCANAWVFTEGGPSENGCAFCPYCGRKLVEVTERSSDAD